MGNIMQENVENKEEIFSQSDIRTKLFLYLYKEKIHLVTMRRILELKKMLFKIG